MTLTVVFVFMYYSSTVMCSKAVTCVVIRETVMSFNVSVPELTEMVASLK